MSNVLQTFTPLRMEGSEYYSVWLIVKTECRKRFLQRLQLSRERTTSNVFTPTLSPLTQFLDRVPERDKTGVTRRDYRKTLLRPDSGSGRGRRPLRDREVDRRTRSYPDHVLSHVQRDHLRNSRLSSPQIIFFTMINDRRPTCNKKIFMFRKKGVH